MGGLERVPCSIANLKGGNRKGSDRLHLHYTGFTTPYHITFTKGDFIPFFNDVKVQKINPILFPIKGILTVLLCTRFVVIILYI